MKQKVFLTMCMLVLSLVSFAQNPYTVTGYVLDPDGLTVIGAVIMEKDNPSIAASTNADGRFSLKVSSPESIVVIRYAGFKTIELPVNSPLFQEPITMQEDAQAIQGVTVVGYGTLRSSDVTGSVDVVSSDLETRGMVNSASEMIMGKVAGLQVTQGNGQPGSGSTIRIRGGSSLSASNNPLVVIDGVPVADNAGAGMSNPLGSINPNDIATFTVLKDASSAAIYGSRGANGVIIITTKKGAASRFSLSYNSDYSISVVGKTVETLSGEEYREFAAQYYGDDADFMANVNKYSDNTDWQDMLYRPAFGTNQYISGSGRVDGKHIQMGYRASLGYTSQQGTIKGSNYDRYTLDIGLAPKFFDQHLSIDINFKGTISTQDNIDGDIISNAAFYDPTKPVYEEYPDNKFNGYYAHVNDNISYEPNVNSSSNPMAVLNEQYNRDNSKRMIGNVQLDYKMHFLPDLHANLNLGYDASIGKNENGVNINSEQAWRNGNFPGVGQNTQWTGYRRNSLLDFYLNYSKELGKNYIDAMIGYSWQHFQTEDYTQTYGNEAEANSTPFSTSEDLTENYLVSFFGRLNYSYDNRYMITATLRYDGSSRFSEANRWGVFPSVAIGWNLAEESWLKDSEINNLKIRASWGITGQQELNLNDYPYQARYDISTDFSQYMFGDTWYNLLKPLAYDENIKWEETTSYNIGVDFAAFSSRLTFNVDLYQKQTKDLLNTASVPAGTNFSNTVTTNIGDLENKGIEVQLGGDIIRNDDWRWNVSVNATWQDTKITRLTSTDDPNYLGILHGSISVGTSVNVMLHAVGYAPSSFYVYEQVYDEDGKPLQNVFVDRNGDGTISDADRYIAGSIQPDMYFGFSTSLSYKNWDFSINAHGSIGYEIFNDFNMAYGSTTAADSGLGFLNNMTTAYRETGFTGVSENPQNLSDYWLEDGSFLRIDNITLGYNFSDLFSANGLDGRISFTAQNPFLFTNYSGLDPETSWGVDGVIWPRPTIYMIGLSLNF